MKKEDFDSEVNALFEEDSILAQAVIELQQRKARIEAERAQATELGEAENADATPTASDDNTDLPDASEPLQDDALPRDGGADDADAAPTEAAIDAEAEIPDAPVGDAEAPAVSDSGDLPEKKTKKIKRKKTSLKKEKEPLPPKNTSIATTVELLEFVSGEKTVRPEGPSPLFDFGFPTPNYAAQESDEEIAPLADVELAEKPENEAESEIPLEDATDVGSETEATGEDGAADDVSNASDDGAEDILPDPDEELTSENEAFGTDENAELTDAPVAEYPPEAIAAIEGYGAAEFFAVEDGLTAPELDTKAISSDDESETPFNEDEEAELDDSEEQDDVLEDEVDAPEEIKKTDSTEQAQKKPAEKARFIDGVFDFLELFIFSLAAVLLITTFFFRHSVVDGSSMEQTLSNGEHIIISNFFYEPERGDVIVCEDYSLSNEYYHKPLVKRIIAIPGDTVEIKYNHYTKRSTVYVNGQMLDEPYVYIDEYPEYRNDSGKWKVGEGEVFVMGDHRNNSSDSRDIGCIRIDSIIGKALFRFYPFEKFGKIE